MAITRTNINTAVAPTHNSPGEPCNRKDNKQIIKIHKDYDDAVKYAEHMVLPTGTIDTVFYKDNDKAVTCLIVVGNIPNSTPVVFSAIKHVEETALSSALEVTEKAADTITETVTNTITETTEKIVKETVLWNQFDTSNGTATDTPESDSEIVETTTTTVETTTDDNTGELSNEIEEF